MVPQNSLMDADGEGGPAELAEGRRRGRVSRRTRGRTQTGKGLPQNSQKGTDGEEVPAELAEERRRGRVSRRTRGRAQKIDWMRWLPQTKQNGQTDV